MKLGRLRVAQLVFAMMLPVSMSAQGPYKFKFDQPHGQYTVGFRTSIQYDEARAFNERFDELGKPYTGDRGRPIQRLTWYPAKKTSAAALTFGDYVDLSASEEGPAKGDVAKSLSYAHAIFGTYLAQRMWAVRDAAMETGRFPVVIYIGYLIGYASTLPDTDMSEIAVAGFSWGGISNLFAAARDSRVDALVSLDGSARYFPKLIKDSGDVHPDQISVPILFFTSANSTLEDMAGYHEDATEDALNDLTHTDLTIVHMHAMQHGNFSSMMQRSGTGPNGHLPPNDYSPTEANEPYEWVARYTLQFLNGTFKHDAAAVAFLKRTPVENGAPPHFITIDAHPASGIVTTLDSFRSQIGQRGFDHVSEIYADFKKASPDFKLDEQQVNAWGYLLINEGHISEAIAIVKLNTEMYPKSTNTWDALGEAYRSAGHTPNAIAAFRKALEIDPKNTAVESKLKELQK